MRESRHHRAILSPIALLLGAALLGPESTEGAEIVLRTGKQNLKGAVREATYEEVRYRLEGTSRDQTVSADQVLRIIWGSEENAGLKNARGALEQGDYAEADRRLKSQINHSDPRIKANAQYLMGVVHLRWGNEDASHYSEAVDAFKRYLSEFESQKDFYVPHATLRLAEAYTAQRKYSDAEQALGKLQRGAMGQAWVVGAKLGLAEIKLAQGGYAEARGLFGELTSSSEVLSDPEFAGKAHLGYAKSQLGQQQYGPAIQTVRDKLLVKANDRPARLDRYAAQGFLVWGQAEESQAGSDQTKLEWALIRYIRAATIAPAHSEDLAEALYRMQEVWRKLGRQGNAEEVRTRLREQCPNSPWAKK